MTGRMQPEAIDPKQYSEVLAAARKGDAQALRKLLKDCEGEVGDCVAKKIPIHVRGAFDEMDVLQVTFLEATLGLSKFLGSTRSRFIAWTKTIAEHNLRDACDALDCKKRPDRRRRVAIGPPSDSYTTLLEQLGGSITTPSRYLAQGEIKAKVDAALEALPPDYRLVIQAYDLENRSIADVMTLMRRSKGAVHMLRRRAHERLRDLMGASANFFSS